MIKNHQPSHSSKKTQGPWKSLRNAAVRVVGLAAALTLSAFCLSSGDKMNLTDLIPSADDRDTVFAAASANLLSTSLGEIHNTPKRRVLPLNNEPTPVPNSENFVKTEDAEHQNYDGSPTDHYRDDSIEVTCWKEKINGVVYAFSDVKIAHPSQFRRKIVDDVINENHVDYPLNIFQRMHGVVGMTSDYCAYRSYGITVQYGKTVREKPNGMLDVLVCDNDGNFTCMPDKDYAASQFSGGRDVMFTFSFGPTMVNDYKLNSSSKLDDYIIARVGAAEPRAAVGQFGYELHYLLCTVEQSGPHATGASVRTVAEVMQAKGVRVAYNMDGGQTAALMYNNRLFNNVAYGGQRKVSDILFFATAVPEKQAD